MGMIRLLSFATAFLAASPVTVSFAADATITGPVLSVYEDGFRVADDKAQAIRVFTWTLCGDSTRDHIARGDSVTVEGDREWRMLDARSVTKADGSPACPAEAAPKY
jgi:hypothetical protein